MKKIVLILISVLAITIIVLSILVWQRRNQQTTSVEEPTPPGVYEVEKTLVEGFPEFPVYPGAVIEESSELDQVPDARKGYYAEWEIDEILTATEVMNWYFEELQKTGWTIVEYPNDREATGEQVARVEKGEYLVYLEVSVQENFTEIEIFIPEDVQN